LDGRGDDGDEEGIFRCAVDVLGSTNNHPRAWMQEMVVSIERGNYSGARPSNDGERRAVQVQSLDLGRENSRPWRSAAISAFEFLAKDVSLVLQRGVGISRKPLKPFGDASNAAAPDVYLADGG
jgi:hypothetical protein